MVQCCVLRDGDGGAEGERKIDVRGGALSVYSSMFGVECSVLRVSGFGRDPEGLLRPSHHKVHAPPGFQAWGLGSRVQISGFRFFFKVWGLGIRVQD